MPTPPFDEVRETLLSRWKEQAGDSERVRVFLTTVDGVEHDGGVDFPTRYVVMRAIEVAADRCGIEGSSIKEARLAPAVPVRQPLEPTFPRT